MNVIHSDPVCFFEHGLAWNSRGLRLLWHGFPDAFVSLGMDFQTPSSASLDFLTPSSASLDFLTPSSALRKKR
jgi:hypothetical protein